LWLNFKEEPMYFPYFMAYMSVGLVLSLVAFFWALNSGQFKEQQRARYLPLENDGSKPAAASRWGRYELTALVFLASAGLAASAAVIVFALVKAP
jgi:cbb3-type cytochrome oxidase maturation protein